MASNISGVTPIMDEFNMRELLARNIKRDLRSLLIATARSVNKHPVCWSDVKAMMPIPVDKSLAMTLIAEEGVVEHWDI
ncbi:MAG: hypothetical protein JWM78_265 [Verrucomicrobiaceae bacterium]|nr:hypothetical protein [Verrucomicrobiaceae bacterium]